MVNARITIFHYKLSNQIFVQFNDLSGYIFSLARLFNVEITDNLFNFITASFSEMKGWIKRFSLGFDYTRVLVERFNYRLNYRFNSPTCFQSINPTWIDLILINQENLFSNSNTCEVGISDHHHLVSTMLNKKISKGSTKTLFYRDYKKFEENKFARDLTHELQNIKNLSYSQFEKAFVTVLDNHVPLKKK